MSSLVTLAALLVACFLSSELESVKAAPLSLQAQFQTALQRIAELEGDGTFEDCCNISQTMQDVFKTNPPTSGIFDIPDVCGEQTNSFFKDVPTTQARCDREGWTVILRRNKNVSLQVDFVLPWADYERGFGDLNTEFWYGLRNIHCLTNQDEMELQIEVRQDDGTGQVWTYGYFEVDGPENNYTLHIGQAQGHSGGRDNLAYHNGMQFSTTDRDNDLYDISCAIFHGGSGWWYNRCYRSLLTGSHTSLKLRWHRRYFHFAEMKLRPKKCKIIEDQSCD